MRHLLVIYISAAHGIGDVTTPTNHRAPNDDTDPEALPRTGDEECGDQRGSSHRDEDPDPEDPDQAAVRGCCLTYQAFARADDHTQAQEHQECHVDRIRNVDRQQ